MIPFRVFFRALDRVSAPRRTGLRRLVCISALAGAVLLSSTLPAGAAEPPAGAAEPPADRAPRSALLAFLEAVGELGARLSLSEVSSLRDASRGEARDGAQAPPVKKEKPSCREAGKGEIPDLVAAIFRCHLRKTGFNDQEVSQFVAEAVVVSKCESFWDPKIVVFDGKYLDVPHPRTGYRYSAAGVFQFIRKTADKWIDGGYANVKKPRYNIDAAARLFIHNRTSGLKGWEDWACAAANDGFKHGSVLPNYPGGPSEMPAWSWTY